jgi:hypothetical protein
VRLSGDDPLDLRPRYATCDECGAIAPPHRGTCSRSIMATGKVLSADGGTAYPILFPDGKLRMSYNEADDE